MKKIIFILLIYFLENKLIKKKKQKQIMNIPAQKTVLISPLSKETNETQETARPEITIEEFLSTFPEALLIALDIKKDEINFEKFQTAIKRITEIYPPMIVREIGKQIPGIPTIKTVWRRWSKYISKFIPKVLYVFYTYPEDLRELIYSYLQDMQRGKISQKEIPSLISFYLENLQNIIYRYDKKYKDWTNDDQKEKIKKLILETFKK